MVLILPGFTGSGKSIVGRPFTTSPNTSIDAAPFSWVPPSHVTERVVTDLLPPQPASNNGIAIQVNRRMTISPQGRRLQGSFSHSEIVVVGASDEA
jgi:hypothetical protein